MKGRIAATTGDASASRSPADDRWLSAKEAAAYMGLSLDLTLSDDEYARELEKLHTTWASYLQSSSVFNNHRHSVMKARYHSVSCPACSLLTAMVSQDEGMNILFRTLTPLNLEERKHFMESRGFSSLLNIMIPSAPILEGAGLGTS